MSHTSPFRPSASSPLPRLGLVQVSCTGILWGTGGLAVVLVRRHAELSALTISAYRTGIAAVVVLAVVLALRRLPGVRRVITRSPVRAVGVGLLTGAYQGLYFVSVVAVGVTVSTVVSLGLAPVLLTGAASWRTRTAPSPRAAAVVAAALVGLVLVAGSSGTGTGTTGPQPLLGILAALGAGTAFAAATALGEPLARSADPLAITAVTTTVATLGLAPLALTTAAIGGSPVVTTDPAALLILLYLGAVTMALAYGLLYAGLRTTTSSNAVVATLLEPVTAAAVAALFLGEALRPAGAVGSLLILLALAGSDRPNPATTGTTR